MSEIQIDHEAAKEYAEQAVAMVKEGDAYPDEFHKLCADCFEFVAPAYLDLQQQLAAERARSRRMVETWNAWAEKENPRGHKMLLESVKESHQLEGWQDVYCMQEEIERLRNDRDAERARVVALVELVREVVSRAQTTELEHLYKWIPEQLAAILNAHAQGDEG